MTNRLSAELIKGGYDADTPAAIVYKATWDDEKVVVGTVGNLHDMAQKEGITGTAVVLVGNAVKCSAPVRSKLYDPAFSTQYRKASENVQGN